MNRLRQWLTEPAVQQLDADGVNITVAHRQVVRNKTILRRLFEGFYRECRTLDAQYFGNCPGVRMEIGSGASFFKEVFPDTLTSDIKPLPFVDVVTRAEQLPLAEASLRALYAINVFHHLPDPRAFFRELLRVLQPGGGVILIEPYYGPFARLLFKHLHTTEGYEVSVPHWEADLTGPMSGANQALSYVVFVRDREILSREFPQLEIVLDRPHTHLLYLLSGGVNFRQLIPDWCAGLVSFIERLLKPLNPWLAIQHTVVLRKKTDAGK